MRTPNGRRRYAHARRQKISDPANVMSSSRRKSRDPARLPSSSFEKTTAGDLNASPLGSAPEARALPRKLLAQRPPLSQAPRPMNSSGRSQTCARVLVAAVLFAAFSWALVVSVSPQLHACIHADANRGDHACAITLIASGSYEHAAQPPLIAPKFDVSFPLSATLRSTWVKPLFLDAHIFAHAPPAHS